MAIQQVTIQLPTTRPHEIDEAAVKLQIAKVVNAGATNGHGVQITSLTPSNPTGNAAAPTYLGTQVVATVTT